MRMYGCTHIQLNFKLRYNLKISYMSISINKISIVIVSDINRRSEIHDEEDSEDEHVPFKLAGYYGYD